MSVLRSAQFIMLRILQYVDYICNENKIKYSLEAGTLLGAVRHKGFIPWDDDIDLVMPRPDYERFVAIAPDLLPNSLSLHNRSTDSKHPWPWVKIRDRSSEIIERGWPGREGPSGIFVDIYPVDVVLPGYFWIDWLYDKTFNLWNKARKRGVPWLARPVENLVYSFREKIIVKKEVAFMKQSNKYVNIYCRYRNERDVTLTYGDIFPLRKIIFEGVEASVINNYEALLVAMYGQNYMTPPPPEKRVAHALSIRV